MPPVKELHYLDKLNRTRRFDPPRSKDECDSCFLESMKNLSAQSSYDLQNYGELFRHKGALLSGDISPAYSTLNDEVIERVVNYFPNTKVIFIARDPVERAWSQLSMGVRLGMISRFDATGCRGSNSEFAEPSGADRAPHPQQSRSPLETLCSSGILSRLFLRRS